MLCRKPREVAQVWGSCKKYWLTPKHGEKLATTASVCYGKRTYKGESTNGVEQGKGKGGIKIKTWYRRRLLRL